MTISGHHGGTMTTTTLAMAGLVSEASGCFRFWRKTKSYQIITLKIIRSVELTENDYAVMDLGLRQRQLHDILVSREHCTALQTSQSSMGVFGHTSSAFTASHGRT